MSHPITPNLSCVSHTKSHILSHTLTHSHTQVTLIELPLNSSETIQVTCANRTATLHLRSQRVVYNGEVMSASRFEQVREKRGNIMMF